MICNFQNMLFVNFFYSSFNHYNGTARYGN